MDTDTYSKWGRGIEKRDLDITFKQRTPGNDLLKFQFDFYTGDPIPTSDMGDQFIDFQFLSVKNYLLGGVRFYGDSKKLGGVLPYGYNSGFLEKKLGLTYGKDLVLPPNQWVTLAVTIDFIKAKIYFEIPHLGIVYEYNSLPFTFTDPTSTDEPNTNGTPYLLRIAQVRISPDVGPRTVHFKYDNFNITAINTPPTPTVSVADLLSNSFNLFPNPANNIINITNSEHHLVQSIKIYDAAGKLLKTKTFNNEKEVQVNIESLASGTYMLHIKTNQGTTVKKVVKN